MKETLASLWSCLLRPREGFRALAERRPTVGDALQRLFLLRLPLGLLHAWFAGKAFLLAWGQFRDPDSDLWRQALARFGDASSAENLRDVLAALPKPPAWNHLAPWILLLAPLSLLSLWLHDAAWDHLGLWLLRGLRKEDRVQATLAAEAEALRIGTVGVVVALLGLLPGVGLPFQLLALPLGAYLWGLRGVALAAFHGCPTWKGVVATVLHLLLFGCFTCGLLALTWFVALGLAAG